VPLKDALKDGEASSAKVALAACVSVIETFIDRTRWYAQFKHPLLIVLPILSANMAMKPWLPQYHASGDEI
jgi:hypothetical protein